MIWVRNKILPARGFKAVTLWPFCFYREPLNIFDKNHERIHARQQVELLLIGFYIVYFIEWIAKGYDRISFEREAYNNEANMRYLKNRKAFSFIKYFI